jgi:hypothetical protein
MFYLPPTCRIFVLFFSVLFDTPVMVTVVFLTDEDDRNIKKKLIFFNVEHYFGGINNRRIDQQ